MTSRYQQIALVFFGAVLVRLFFHGLTGFTYDDAFITFRYAENIVAGDGFVYNVGERVLGTSTPLFTLVLVVLGICGVSLIKGALGLSLLCSGLTAVVLYRFASSLRYMHWTLLPLVIYILFPRLLPIDSSGMETAFFTLLVTAAFYYQHRGQDYYAIGAATLASVTRPEGLAALGVLLAANVIREPRRTLSLLLVPAVVIVPWALFAFYYFGSPVPHSIAAKLSLYSRFGSRTPWENVSFLMGWHSPFGLPLLAMVLAGGWWLIKKQDFGRIEIIWLLGMIIPLSLSRTYMFLWYIAPVYPIYILLASAVFPLIADRVVYVGKRSRSLSAAAVVVMGLILIVANYKSMYFYRDYQYSHETIHKAIGLFLRANVTEGQVVAAEDIGYMGYYSGARILDRDGLVSPSVVPYNREGRYLELLLDRCPDWVVVSPQSANATFLDSLAFLEVYGLERKFVRSTGGYWVYRLRGGNDVKASD